jgi:hypothetical protein
MMHLPGHRNVERGRASDRRRRFRPRSALLALFLLLPAAASAALLIEGRMAGASDGLRYDLLVEVSKKPGEAGGESRSLQSIRIPLVTVTEGRFEVALSTGLEAYALSDLSILILARPSESHRPFEPVEVSRVATVP